MLQEGTSKSFRPPLQPIPVGGPFHRIWAVTSDTIVATCGLPYQMTKGLCYSRSSDHGILEELLSDCGANLQLELILVICKELDVKKINMSSYHPLTV